MAVVLEHPSICEKNHSDFPAFRHHASNFFSHLGWTGVVRMIPKSDFATDPRVLHIIKAGLKMLTQKPPDELIPHRVEIDMI